MYTLVESTVCKHSIEPAAFYVLFDCSYRNAVLQGIFSVLGVRGLKRSMLGKLLLQLQAAMFPARGGHGLPKHAVDIRAAKFRDLVQALDMIFPFHKNEAPSQQDAHEFLVRVLDYLQSKKPITKQHDRWTIVDADAGAKKHFSDLFAMRTTASRTRLQDAEAEHVCACCHMCGHSLSSAYTVEQLTMEMPNAVVAGPTDERVYSLPSLIAHEHQTTVRDFGVVSDVEGGWECGAQKTFCGCRYTLIEETVAMTHAPPILCIRLGRHQSDGQKNHLQVQIESILALPVRPLGPDAPQSVTAKYRLQSVVLHRGYSIHSGHYALLRRHDQGHWTLFDDSHVEVLGISAGVPNPVGWDLRRNAYILFYVLELHQPTRIATADTVASRLQHRAAHSGPAAHAVASFAASAAGGDLSDTASRSTSSTSSDSDSTHDSDSDCVPTGSRSGGRIHAGWRTRSAVRASATAAGGSTSTCGGRSMRPVAQSGTAAYAATAVTASPAGGDLSEAAPRSTYGQYCRPPLRPTMHTESAASLFQVIHAAVAING